MTDEIWGMKVVLDENVPPNALYILDAKGKEFILRIISLQNELKTAKEHINYLEEEIQRQRAELVYRGQHLEDANQRIASMERELLGVKRIVELAYENRLAIPGMLQAINDYEDALKPD